MQENEKQSENSKYIVLEAEYFFSNGKKNKLINSTDETYKIKLKNEEISFDLKKHFYVSKIYLAVNNVDKERMRLSFSDVTGKTVKANFLAEESDDTKLTFQLGGIINKFIIKYDSGFLDWANPQIFGVSVLGLPLDELESFYPDLIDISKTRKNLENRIKVEEDRISKETEAIAEERSLFEKNKINLEKKVNELETSIQELENQKKNNEIITKETIELLNVEKEKFEETKKGISQLLTSKSELESNIETSKNKLEALQEENKVLEQKVREQRKIFASYSNEYSEFNKQSNWYIFFYGCLTIFPITILSFVLYKLFVGSIDLTTIYKNNDNIDTWTIFITRLPFVTVAGFLIHGSYVIFKLIALKIMDIQSEKLSLSKIAIIAQDQVNLSSEKLDLTDEQIQDANIYLRMELFKAYMKETIGKDFEYKTRDSKILDSIKEHIVLKLMPQKWREKLELSSKQ